MDENINRSINYNFFGEKGDLAKLTKFRLSLFTVFTSICAYFMAIKYLKINSYGEAHAFNLFHFLHFFIGVMSAALGASVYNQILEIDSDKSMIRTSDRPLPKGRIKPTSAFIIGWFLCTVGVVHIMAKINFVSALIVLLTLILYIFVYTPLKKITYWNTLFGSIVGALPPIAGWTANLPDGILNSWNEITTWLLSKESIFLFLFLFLWQIPHFLSLAWIYKNDYKKSDYQMLTNDDHTGKKTSTTIFIAFLLLTSILILFKDFAPTRIPPFFYLIFITSNLISIIYSIKFSLNRTKKNARYIFFSGLIYLPLILISLLIFYK